MNVNPSMSNLARIHPLNGFGLGLVSCVVCISDLSFKLNTKGRRRVEQTHDYKLCFSAGKKGFVTERQSSGFMYLSRVDMILVIESNHSIRNNVHMEISSLPIRLLGSFNVLRLERWLVLKCTQSSEFLYERKMLNETSHLQKCFCLVSEILDI